MIKLTGWEAEQIPKGVNKAALFYVEVEQNAHCTYTCEPKCFYWLVNHLHSNTFCVLYREKWNMKNREQQHTTNEPAVKFHDQSNKFSFFCPSKLDAGTPAVA